MSAIGTVPVRVQHARRTMIAYTKKRVPAENAWILAIQTRVPANSQGAVTAVTMLAVIAHQPVARADMSAIP